MHKSKHSDRRERERRNTGEAKQTKTWNSHPGRKSSVCQSSSSASWLPERQQEIPNVPLTLRIQQKGKKFCKGIVYFDILNTARFLIPLTKKKSSFTLSMAAQSRVFLECIYTQSKCKSFGKKNQTQPTTNNFSHNDS